MCGVRRVVKGAHGLTWHPRVYPRNEWNEPYLPLPSKPKLVLIYLSQRVGRLSWPSWLQRLVIWCSMTMNIMRFWAQRCQRSAWCRHCGYWAYVLANRTRVIGPTIQQISNVYLRHSIGRQTDGLRRSKIRYYPLFSLCQP